MPEWLESLEQRLETILPFWTDNLAVQGIALVVLSIVLAKLADWVLSKVVARWVRSTGSDLDDRLLEALHGPIFNTVLVLGLWLTAHRLELSQGVRYVTFGILGTLVIVQWLFASVAVVSLLLHSLGQKGRASRLIKPDTVPLFDNLAKIGLFGLASYLALNLWQLDVTGWLAGAGIAGLAIGFAARDSLANLFAGVFIFGDAPYRVGDFISLDTGERGQVTDIGLRSTRLLTRDDVQITIPNSVIGNAKIVNESGGPSPSFRIRVQVGVAYGSDIDQVREVLLGVANAARECGLVLPDPEPRVRFRAFGGSSLDFELLCWVSEPVLRGRVLDQLNSDVYRAFRRTGIEIPYSKHDLYIKEMPR